jgi:hypothetical protein
MQYTLNAASGNAGEYFFAYQIAHVLKWPCRLLDIDIGIDGQVEVINDDRTSTGRFIAIQVKAKVDDKPKTRYVTENQLAYWLELNYPVFVVKVNLKNSKMYLHLVSKNVQYRRTPKGAVCIDFDLKQDIFDSKTAERFSRASMEVAMQHIRPWLDKVKDGTKAILENIQYNVNESEAWIVLIRSRVDLNSYLANASALVNALSVDSDDYSDVSTNLADALEELRKLLRPYGLSPHSAEYHEEIKAFLDEPYHSK